MQFYAPNNDIINLNNQKVTIAIHTVIHIPDKQTRASISQDYWGDIKEDWEFGGRKSPSGIQGQSPGRGPRERSPPEA